MKAFSFILTLVFFYQIRISSQEYIPEWAKGVVWYQIFPERFANGDRTNDPTSSKVFSNEDKKPVDWEISDWTGNWFERSSWEKNLGKNFNSSVLFRRYGGDIQGIIDHLDYLSDLGIGAIYINPVFDAVSLHKYDGSTFHHIDLNFGLSPANDDSLIQTEKPNLPETWTWTSADSLFLKLIAEIHKRGMRIIIDGVFNHTGIQFWAFQDIVKLGKKSQFKDWYIIKSFDDPLTPSNEFDYKGWWGAKSLPEFNRSENDLHPGPKQYIFHATKRWMDPNNDGDPSDGIDGWRLDVAREVPIGFWNDWKKLVKSINPNAIIAGELWELSPEFVSQNGVFNSLMNYSFAFAVNDFFIAKKKRIKVSEFIRKLKEIDNAYPEENLDLLQNLVDSHDTDRLLSMIVNPDRGYDRDNNEQNPNYSPSKPSDADFEVQKLIAAFQLTYRGAPMIYYGDEAGMWGADDPHDRKPMVWDYLRYKNEIITEESGFKKGFGVYEVNQNHEIRNFYKKLIYLRKNNPSLIKGSLKFLYSNDDKETFVFERKFNDNWFVAAFNIGNETDEIDLKLNIKKLVYDEKLTGETGSFVSSGRDEVNFKFSIPGASVKIYQIYSQNN